MDFGDDPLSEGSYRFAGNFSPQIAPGPGNPTKRTPQ